MSLVEYNVYLLNLGPYPYEVVEELETRFKDSGSYGKGEIGLKRSDSGDEAGSRGLIGMRRVRRELFHETDLHEA